MDTLDAHILTKILDNDARNLGKSKKVNNKFHELISPCQDSRFPLERCIEAVHRYGEEEDCYDCLAEQTDGDVLAILASRSRQFSLRRLRVPSTGPSDDDGEVDSETLISLIQDPELKSTAEHLLAVTSVRRKIIKWSFSGRELDVINPDSPVLEGLTAADVYEVECAALEHLPHEWQTMVQHVKVEHVDRLADDAFAYCNSLITVYLPPVNFVHIGSRAFLNCTNLISIDFPSSLESIGKEAFSWCDSINTVVLPPRLKDFDKAFHGIIRGAKRGDDLHSKLTTVRFSEGIQHIGKMAFYENISLKTIEFPQSLTYIGEYAFSWCTSLTTLYLPEKLKRIGKSAFSSCYGLTTINFPEGTTNIDEAAFWGCRSLTTINLPQGLTHIGRMAFDTCSFTTIDFPEGLTHIGDEAFSMCGSLTTIDLPRSLTHIGKGAFNSCRRLQSVTVHTQEMSEMLKEEYKHQFKIVFRRKRKELDESFVTLNKHARLDN